MKWTQSLDIKCISTCLFIDLHFQYVKLSLIKLSSVKPRGMLIPNRIISIEKRVTGISQEKSFFVYRNRQGHKPQHDVCSK